MLEDEGRAIGANGLPEPLRVQMAQASLVVVEDPFERRLERLKEEYFDRMTHDFTAAYGEEKGVRHTVSICITGCQLSGGGSARSGRRN